MKGMILAAGYGTRLRPLTWMLPKPMVPLCNRPLIGWAVEAFRQAGIHDLIVNVHHLPEKIASYLHETCGNEIDCFISVEQEILGTGGGVRRVRDRLTGEEPFFLVNADTIQFPHYQALAEALRSSGSLAALTLRHPPAGDRFTPVWRNPEGGWVTGFGTGEGEALMFAGSHAISPRIFDHLPDRAFSGIVEDVYQPVISSGSESLTSVLDDGLWFDIGTPDRYLSASAGILDAIIRGEVKPPAGSELRDDSLLHQTASASGSVVHSVAGAGSSIAGNIRESILWSDCVIGRGVTLDRCIVASGVTLDKAVHLRNVIICPEDPAIPADYRRLDGLVIVNTGE
ncbi:MAG TPA: NDP-sugar synthase [Thermoanaerobaculia bacterium]